MRISVDDACASDWRLAELCNRYEVPCTFYWPVEWHHVAVKGGYMPIRYSRAKQIADNFEIGSHGITHFRLTDLKGEVARYEIVHSRHLLEDIFDTKVEKFAPPRGFISEPLMDFAKQIYREIRLTVGKGLLHVHPNSGANGKVHWMERAKNEKVEELWCHSWELDKYNEWNNLEKYLASLLR